MRFQIQNLTRGFAGAKLQLIFGLAKSFTIYFFSPATEATIIQ